MALGAPILGLAVSVLSGSYTSAWGAFKDSPYEGFCARRFPRSILFSVATYVALWLSPATRSSLLELSLPQVFLLVMGVERLFTEIYKACFRETDQSRYQIPQYLTFFGNRVTSRPLRLAVGIGCSAAIALVVGWNVEIVSFPAFLLASAATGAFVACGGAYKDAPFEGFQPRKFFRSILVLAAAAPLFWALGPTRLGFLLFIAGGLERLIVEYYKSYVARSVPGKFRSDLPVIEGTFLGHRPKLYVHARATIGILAILYIQAWLSRSV